MSPVPIDSDALLLRERTAEELTKAGYKTAPATLATMASRGGGPPYSRYGQRAVYRWGDALAWAQSRLSSPRRTTSEHETTAPNPANAENTHRLLSVSISQLAETTNEKTVAPQSCFRVKIG